MLARSVGLALRREIHTVFVLPAVKLRRAKLPGAPLTLLVTAATGLLWILERTGTGTAVVTKLVDVYSALPLGATLQRLPGSLFAPALDLPVVGALVQVVIVFGVAELTIGRWQTLTVALLAQAVATASADLMVWLGPQTVLGVDQSVAFVRDTGPSVAVTALSVYVCFICRARIMLLLVVGAMLVEVGLKPDLAGREHVVAVVCGLLFAALIPFVTRLRRSLLGLDGLVRREPRDRHVGGPLPAGVPGLARGLLLPRGAVWQRLRLPARTARGAGSSVAQTVSSPVRKASARQRLVVLPDRGFGALSADLVLGWTPAARLSVVAASRARPKARAAASAGGRGVAGDA